MIPFEERNDGAAGPVVFTDLFKHRDDLKRQLEGVEMGIERCGHDYKYVPAAKFEARANKWVKLTFRTCRMCGQVCENADAEPGKSLGLWTQLKK
jgi:hypothetical protein